MVLRVRVLGPVGVWDDDSEVVVPSGKPLGALAMLALHPTRPVPVERLAVGLWGEEAPPSVSKTLQVHISTLRRRLRPHGIDVKLETAGYRLSAEAARFDIVEFEELVGTGQRALEEGRPEVARKQLRSALAIWTGEPLSNVLGVPFAADEAHRLELERLAIHVLAVDTDLKLGLGATLVDELRALAAANQYHERICGQLMTALYRAGQPAAALEELAVFRRRLSDDLGLLPGSELVELERQVLQHSTELLRAEALSVSVRHNLPEDVSSFVGRRYEPGALRDRLEQARLVTVTGAGGAGKTRLALAVARSRLDEMTNGVWFVDLSSIDEPRFILPTVAEALKVRADDREDLIDAVGSQRMLLVVDNCEHLIRDVAELVTILLRRCPALQVLATSREQLGIDGEALYRVPPLTLPSTNELETVLRSEAVELFVDRARLQQPDFEIDDRSAPLVAGICRRVDGLPLAIELAAARLGSLPLAEISHRLEQQLPSLAGANRRPLRRQQTLRALIEWSYQLLTDEEQLLLERLSVFAGGFGVAAAEAVATPGTDAIELLSLLVSKSMVELSNPTAGRFRLLETVRAYAAERLSARDEDVQSRVRRAHAAHYAELARMGSEALERGRDVTLWVAQFAEEHDNIRVASSNLLLARQHGEALRLASDMRWFWDIRGHFREGADVTTAVLEAAMPSEAPREYGVALVAAADMYSSLGDFGRALQLARQADELSAELEDPRIGVWSALIMADIDVQGGDGESARRRIASLDIAAVDRALTHRAVSVDAHIAAACEDWDRARVTLDQLIEAPWMQGDDRRLSSLLVNRAVVDMAYGHLARARERLDQAYSLAAPLRDATTMCQISINLGLVGLLSGDRVSAYIRYREALLNSSHGEHLLIHAAILGIVLAGGTDPPAQRDAIELHGVLDCYVDGKPLALDPIERNLRDEDRERRRRQVSDAEFDQLTAGGRRMSLADAVNLALSIAPDGTAGMRASQDEPRRGRT